MSSPILAIDFGTSNSLAGFLNDRNEVELLALDPQARDPSLMRTLLYVPKANEVFCGLEALNEYLNNDMEGRLFRSFKTHLPNELYQGTSLFNRFVSLESLVSMFLRQIKKRAEALTKKEFKKALIGRPARYSMDEKKDKLALERMSRAVKEAGFDEFVFMEEPLAAALSYQKNIQQEKIVLVGDFGGGTSDFTIVRLKAKGHLSEDVLAIEGCPLAGDALDSLFMSQRLSEHFGAHAEYQRLFGKNLLKMPPSVMEKLNYPAHIVHLKEKATYEFIKEVQKCTLSKGDQEKIEQLFVLIEENLIFSFFEKIEETKKNLSVLESFTFEYLHPGIKIKEVFTQKKFQKWAEGVQFEIFSALDRCLSMASLKAADIDLLCLTGGTSRVPFIKRKFQEIFGEAKVFEQTQFHSVIEGLVVGTRHYDNFQ